MTTRKKKRATTKRRKLRPAPFVRGYAVGTVDGQPMNPDLRAAFQAAGVLPPEPAAPVTEDNRPRRVVLDNTVPGGFRMEPV